MSNCAINSRFNLGMVGGIPADQLVKKSTAETPSEEPVETPNLNNQVPTDDSDDNQF